MGAEPAWSRADRFTSEFDLLCDMHLCNRAVTDSMAIDGKAATLVRIDTDPDPGSGSDDGYRFT